MSFRCAACRNISVAVPTMRGPYKVCPECVDQGYAVCRSCAAVRYGMIKHNGYYYCQNCMRRCDRCRGIFPRCELNCLYWQALCSHCERTGYFEPRPLDPVSFDDIHSPREFGLELETSKCPNYGTLDKYWGAKSDGSIDGLEFYTAILQGDQGTKAVATLEKVSTENGWAVDRRCGYHLHINMNGESADKLQAIANAYHTTYILWSKYVNSDRVSNCFCRKHRGLISKYDHLKELHAWIEFGRRTNRYTWINWDAYRKFRSLEIRLHEGTLNPDRILNWIKAHTAFADWASSAGVERVRKILHHKSLKAKQANLHHIWKDAGYPHLCEYYNTQEVLV